MLEMCIRSGIGISQVIKQGEGGHLVQGEQLMTRRAALRGWRQWLGWRSSQRTRETIVVNGRACFQERAGEAPARKHFLFFIWCDTTFSIEI